MARWRQARRRRSARGAAARGRLAGDADRRRTPTPACRASLKPIRLAAFLQRKSGRRSSRRRKAAQRQPSQLVRDAAARQRAADDQLAAPRRPFTARVLLSAALRAAAPGVPPHNTELATAQRGRTGIASRFHLSAAPSPSCTRPDLPVGVGHRDGCHPPSREPSPPRGLPSSSRFGPLSCAAAAAVRRRHGPGLRSLRPRAKEPASTAVLSSRFERSGLLPWPWRRRSWSSGAGLLCAARAPRARVRASVSLSL